MPLKIRIKPEEKIFAGGAVLKNVGTRPADLLVLSDSPVLRDNYLMNIERRDDSDVSNIYFLLQVIYLFKGKGQPLDNLVVETLRNFGNIYPNLSDHVEEIIVQLQAGDAFKALRMAHKMLEEKQPEKQINLPEGIKEIAESTTAPV
ncbi:MAG: flagellar biosynthesis repressor FlbT [Alphaproteobacteria bacterium]|nr:flagellar biosynthesis repressor FlbT [Alphaproteobacteria bacterium]